MVIAKRLIIFDWDGTLMDSESKIVRCFQKACEDLQLPRPSAVDIKEIIGLSLDLAMERLLGEYAPEQRAKVVERYRDHFIHLDDTDMAFFPDVIPGLDELTANGYWLAVATGKARRGLDHLLTQWDLHERFIATRCADETFSKPHPQMLLDLLDVTGLNASEAVMVGDTVYDMEMAKNAGMDRLAVSYGVHQAERLQAYEPLSCFDAFGQLLQWFGTRE